MKTLSEVNKKDVKQRPCVGIIVKKGCFEMILRKLAGKNPCWSHFLLKVSNPTRQCFATIVTVFFLTESYEKGKSENLIKIVAI